MDKQHKNHNDADYLASIETCEPVKTYDQVFMVAKNPPSWHERTIQLASRSFKVIDNKNFNCHLTQPNKNSFPMRYEKHKVPRTIVCHDMKNGYLEDKYCDRVNIGNGYIFSNWQNIDAFIYFSHHFITIPPLQWINLAHKNGVQILGTIITEWDAGELLCKSFLQDEAEVDKFVEALEKITTAFKLDGWLINIENPIEEDKVPLLVTFVDKLTKVLHDKMRNAMVLWYDSVTLEGDLKWQNELNHWNRCFFEACDGIFLNYNWDHFNLVTSAFFAEGRQFDVYAGIDVFGRNTSYEAGPDCFRGLQVARNMDLSVAIFAPGWTHETTEAEPVDTFFYRFFLNDQVFWRALMPYLFTHPTNKPFDTNFELGSNESIHDLEAQQLLLVNTTCCFQSLLYNEQCLYQIFKDPFSTTRYTWHHLIATEIELDEEYWFILRTFNLDSDDNKFSLILVFQGEEGKVDSVIVRSCHRHLVKQESDELQECKRIYKLLFLEKSQLLHIYLRLPYAYEVALAGITLVKSSDCPKEILCNLSF